MPPPGPWRHWLRRSILRAMVRSGSAHGPRRRSAKMQGVERAQPLEAAEGNLTLCLSLVGRIDGEVFQSGGYARLSEKRRRLVDEVSEVARRAVADLGRISRGLGLKPPKDDGG